MMNCYHKCLEPRFQNEDVTIIKQILKSAMSLECQNMIKDRGLRDVTDATVNSIIDHRGYILILLGNAKASEWPSSAVMSLTFLRRKGIAIALVRT